MTNNEPHTIAPPRLRTTECEELNVWSDVVGFQTDYHQQGAGTFDAWFDMRVGKKVGWIANPPPVRNGLGTTGASSDRLTT